jgi:hypothetical protein
MKWLLSGLAAAGILAGCSMFVSTPVPDSVIASCVRSNGFADGTRYSVEEVFRTDGMDRRVIPGGDISPAAAGRINSCIEAEVMGGGALPAVAGVPQTVTSETTATGTRTTFTYGTPPGDPAPAALRERASGGGVCRLQMVGGTGYMCR